MDKIQKLKQEKQYEQYVKEKTPRHNLFLNMCKAFFLGGLICLLGQVIYHYFELRNLSPDECSRWMSLSLILLSVLFTGTGIYQKLAAWGGAPAQVPLQRRTGRWRAHRRFPGQYRPAPAAAAGSGTPTPLPR